MADAIADLVGGRFTFAAAHAVWTAAANDTLRIRWDDPNAVRDFLIEVRATIDPFAWPVVKPRFRPADGTAAG